MKIFNWVHRRFNNKEDTKKNGGIADEQFLDENKSNAFESWGGGILTIGTFGYVPLKYESEQIPDACNYLYEECEELEMNQQAVDYEIHSVVSDSEEEVECDDADEEGNPLVYAAYDEEDLMEDEYVEEEFGKFAYVAMEKKARTTLADLFNADSDSGEASKKGQEIKEKLKGNRDVPFGKKLVMLEEARQLMRRIMKRKIHPDIDSIYSKVAVIKKCDFNDHASLLTTHDAII